MTISIVNDYKGMPMKGRFRSAFSLTFKQFCEISSIHGIKYFHDAESCFFAKLIWIVIVVTMFLCAIAMVCIFYLDFASNPIRMNIDSNYMPLSNLVFPAVTICPPTMVNYPEVRRIFQKLSLPANTSLDEAMAALNQLYVFAGKLQFNKNDEPKLIALQRIIERNNMTTYDFMRTIRWKCPDLLYRCRFQSKIVNCSEVFDSSKTNMGYCCSFNINEPGINFKQYPALKFGFAGGLSVILKNTKADQAALNYQTISTEYELYVHQSDEFPHRTMSSYSIQMNREVFTVVRPTEIVCTDEFKALQVKDRQCLLPHEHNMRYFKYYNKDNCEFECRAVSTIVNCGCIPYSYITDANKKEHTCPFTKLSCLNTKFKYFQAAEKNQTIDENSACYCPSSCQYIEYDVQITQAQLQTRVTSFDQFYHGIQENHTVLHVFMNSQTYKRLQRDTLSDVVLLIGNLGSSFSLFVGMSVISLLEIAYFATIVLYKNYKQNQAVRRIHTLQIHKIQS